MLRSLTTTTAATATTTTATIIPLPVNRRPWRQGLEEEDNIGEVVNAAFDLNRDLLCDSRTDHR